MALLQPGAELARYTIVGKLAQGGMAEVYLARQTGPSGFSKVLVVKVILPHLAANPHFVELFENEARLAALLNHPNIVQVFDFGVAQQVHYMVMEYLEGKTLRRVMHQLRAERRLCPHPLALRIISDAANGLQYAHSFSDHEGRHLGIIHRDVALENIILSYAGQVKLVDFGIARAARLQPSSEGGSLEGKLSYLAPEIVKGGQRSVSSDIYALGVVLYALLVGRMPYSGGEAALVRSITESPPPRPRLINPALPEALEAIVLRAMHRDPAQRYGSAGQLQRHLDAYLAQHCAPVLPVQLADLMKKLFPDGSAELRRLSREFAAIDSAGAAISLPPAVPDALPPAPFVAVDPDANEVTAAQAIEAQLQRGRRLFMVLLALAVVLLGAALLVAIPRRSSVPPLGVRDVSANNLVEGGRPDRSVAERPGARPAASPRGPDLAPVNGTEQAERQMDAAIPETVSSQPATGDAVGAAPRAVVRRRSPRAPRSSAVKAMGQLSVQAPGPGEVLVDGQRVGSLPLRDKALAPGTYRVEVRSETRGYALTRRVEIESGGTSRLWLEPRHGTLKILVRPWAAVQLDGKSLGVTPLRPQRVYEGVHQLLLVNEELGIRRRLKVRVQPDRETVVKVRLDQA